jgi:Protein of unknown function (DUF2510)
MAGKDYTRICSRCGGRWLLPKALAAEKSRSPGHVKSLETKARLMPGSFSLPQAVAARSLLDRVMANAQCPHCGSSDYTQYKPGKEPPLNEPEAANAGQVSSTAPPPPPPPPPPPNVPEGWYPDPNNSSVQRYWDGTTWTEHTAPLGPSA